VLWPRPRNRSRLQRGGRCCSAVDDPRSTWSGRHSQPRSAGRAERVRNAVGTVTRTVYDELDRPVQTWVGIDDRGFGQVANGQTKRGDTTPCGRERV
jgi:hypothetical protein